ncbi:hypothetical protein Celaphus_00015425 [Cervus elaphus hippelaphus]|uniref:DUF3496 domain-containing protein n=1 Tax=Cervus elaphus hippelaphus TaxID=46360 RepID=A0A212CS07_CEREH|nr:hypothetical protein Celaphus_00015425 [Cervus elaphus hippelaphus]
MQSVLEASLEVMSPSQENLERLREKSNALISQVELRIKDLESELSKMNIFQEDSNKAELEKYKQLYLEELEVRKSLANKLDKTKERLAEVSTELGVEKQQNRSCFSILTRRPVLGTLHGDLLDQSGQWELQKNVTRALEKGVAEFKSGSYRVCPLGSTDESNLYQNPLLKTLQEYVQILKEKKYDLKDK